MNNNRTITIEWTAAYSTWELKCILLVPNIHPTLNKGNGDTKHNVATSYGFSEYEMATTSEDWLIGDSENYGMLEELGLVDNFRMVKSIALNKSLKITKSSTKLYQTTEHRLRMKELSFILFTESSSIEDIPYVSGGFGDIFQAQMIETQKSVIVKKIKNVKFVDFIRETKIKQYLMLGQYVLEVYVD